ncbi:TPA: polysaccharide pyruvyl transferase family protein [Serratia fonticola]|nr:polysaccharide pyruvyl transferase family protein [Serratia fonticola]
MKNVGLFTSVYFNNIGNAFIDIGAQAAIEAALPNGFQLVRTSQFQNFVNTMSSGMALRESKVLRAVWKSVMKNHASKLHDRLYSALKSKKTINLLDFINLDVLIIPGCVLTVPFFKIYGEELRELKRSGVKILFLGASGNYYTDYEVNYVKNFIKELKPMALMFRDPIAYGHYKDLVPETYNGIDNAFFVNRTKIPTGIAKNDYVVFNFDHAKNENLIKELEPKYNNVVKTNNKPFPLSYVQSLLSKNIFVSDSPIDYLTLLANAKEVHSDRVHSCIPTLSFGGRCKIYSDSKRLALFDNVGLSRIQEEVVSITDLDSYQNNQIIYLNKLLNSL